MPAEEKKSLWCLSAAGVAVAGIIQVSIGDYLQACTGPLFSVGTWLIRQGGYDIILAIRTGLNKAFNWTEYGVEKLLYVPFSAFSVAAERWLHGDSENSYRRWNSTRLMRKLGLFSARGIVVVALGRVLRKAVDRMLENFHDSLVAQIHRLSEHQFTDLKLQIEDLLGLNGIYAQQQILDAFELAVKKMDQERNFSGKIVQSAFEFLPTIVELGLQFLSLRTSCNFGDRTMDCVTFVTIMSISVTEAVVSTRNFVKSLQKSITHCRRSCTIYRAQEMKEADPQNIEEFTERFMRRVKFLLARRLWQRLRRGLVQATGQSFILSGVPATVDYLGF